MKDYTIPNCSRCVKRPHWEGGRGTCPVPDFIRVARYEGKGDHNCTAYKLGRRKPLPPKPVLPEEGLF